MRFYAGGAASDAANRIQYAPHGAVAVLRLANSPSLWEHTLYNSRLQPTEIGLGISSSDSSKLKLEYTYNTPGLTDNNGNLLSQKVTLSGLSLTQNYTYDPVNRLLTASEKVGSEGQARWTQSYTYDQVGNRLTLANSGSEGTLLPTPSTPAVSSTSNRITATGYTYDAMGNLTASADGAAMVYDGESRMVSHTRGGVATSYAYDGDGRRVKKVSGSRTTVYVYSVMGQLLAEYSDPLPEVEGGTKYLTADHLGSTRVVTDATGNVQAMRGAGSFPHHMRTQRAAEVRRGEFYFMNLCVISVPPR